ncbi:MAG: GNAT family N-acetyltransferase, partial [Jiangellaceae bacterium]
MKTAKQTGGAADRVALLFEHLLGGPLPLRIRTWDGAQAGPADGPTLVVRSRRALRRLLWNPDELGLGRAWVAGEIDLEGDLEEALARLETIGGDLAARRHLSPLERAEVLRAASLLLAGGEAGVLNVLVRPDARRNRIAQALLTAAAWRANAEHVRILTVEVIAGTGAAKFYEACGFERTLVE